MTKDDIENAFKQPCVCAWEAESGVCTVAGPSDTAPCIFINLEAWTCRLRTEAMKLASLGYTVAQMKQAEYGTFPTVGSMMDGMFKTQAMIIEQNKKLGSPGFVSQESQAQETKDENEG